MNTTSTYQHLLSIDGQTPESIHGIETLIRAKGVTHVRAMNGKIWTIFSGVNQKSVPLNTGGRGPQRLTWVQVESFGCLVERSAA